MGMVLRENRGLLRRDHCPGSEHQKAPGVARMDLKAKGRALETEVRSINGPESEQVADDARAPTMGRERSSSRLRPQSWRGGGGRGEGGGAPSRVRGRHRWIFRNSLGPAGLRGVA